MIFRPFSILLVAVWLWIVYDLILGNYDLGGFDEVVYQNAILGIGLFVVFASAFDTKPRRASRETRRSVKVRSLNKRFGDVLDHYGDAIYVALFVSGILVYFWRASFDIPRIAIALWSASRFAAPWARGATGDWTAVLDHLSYFGYLMPIVYAYRYPKLGIGRKIAYLFAFLVFTAFIAQGGNRRILGALLLMLAASFLFLNRHGIANRIVAVGLVSALPVVLQTVLSVRGQGIDSTWSQTHQADPVLFSIDDNFLRLCQVVGLFPESVDYLGLEPLFFGVIRYVPRVLWEGKPTGLSFSLGDYFGINASLTSSIIGEAYMSAGLIGTAGAGLIFGCLVAIATKAYRNIGFGVYSFGLYLLCCQLLFLGVRSINEVFIASFPIVALYFLPKMFAIVGVMRSRMAARKPLKHRSSVSK